VQVFIALQSTKEKLTKEEKSMGHLDNERKKKAMVLLLSWTYFSVK
jgi:hypothetical protein